ncbi:ComF family protein [Sphingosinicella sp. LHD-64]|uniref:ComF family protein n=1 Tax=Sphingosinicella sp. LHD-64 TaxID=3072139 RepID=UPI00280E5DAD|nr:ComF family protein [Sphingosinicella sp. LHD-64]MDQ8755553.1 ComF family protein [Sphingosinicella sp. LHD-64]
MPAADLLSRLVMRPALDFALPPRCPGCGAVTADPHRFCLGCWSQLAFLGDPCCAQCALPFDYDAGPDAVCGGCLAHPPRFDRLRAAVTYGEIPRAVALKLKYGRPGVAETMARFMVRHIGAQADAILVPVPLHRWRIWRRGYNQAALIAGALARQAGLEARLDLIARIRRTPPLKEMSPRERREVLRGAFKVPAYRKAEVKGRAFILVDDVYTSGATANGCARALKRAGAERVDVVTWARVVKNADH